MVRCVLVIPVLERQSWGDHGRSVLLVSFGPMRDLVTKMNYTGLGE